MESAGTESVTVQDLAEVLNEKCKKNGENEEEGRLKVCNK